MKNVIKSIAISIVLILGVTPQLSNLNAQALPILGMNNHIAIAQSNSLFPITTLQRVTIRPEKPEFVTPVMIR
jgi:hypothetical protein